MSAENNLVLQLVKRVHNLELNQGVLLERISTLEKLLPPPKKEEKRGEKGGEKEGEKVGEKSEKKREEGGGENLFVKIAAGMAIPLEDIYTKAKFRPFWKITPENVTKKFDDLLKNPAFSALKSELEKSKSEDTCEISGPGNLYSKATGIGATSKAKFDYLLKLQTHPEYFRYAIITYKITTDNPTSDILDLFIDGQILRSRKETAEDLWTMQGVYRSYLVTKKGFPSPEFTCSLLLDSTKKDDNMIMASGKGNTRRRAREEASRRILEKHAEWVKSLTYEQARKYQDAQ